MVQDALFAQPPPECNSAFGAKCVFGHCLELYIAGLFLIGITDNDEVANEAGNSKLGKKVLCSMVDHNQLKANAAQLTEWGGVKDFAFAPVFIPPVPPGYGKNAQREHNCGHGKCYYDQCTGNNSAPATGDKQKPRYWYHEKDTAKRECIKYLAPVDDNKDVHVQQWQVKAFGAEGSVVRFRKPAVPTLLLLSIKVYTKIAAHRYRRSAAVGGEVAGKVACGLSIFPNALLSIFSIVA